MGFELRFQALPAGCELLHQVQLEHELGELLARVPTWYRDGAPIGLETWPDAQRIFACMVEMERQFPGISQRNLDLARVFDQLHYLLSANRRDESGDEIDTMMDLAIRGRSPIGEHVRGGQGGLVRLTPADDVACIADLLDCLTPEDLMRHFDPVRMEGRAVYKFHADRVPADDEKTIKECFVQLQHFYRSAAEHGEAVIVVLD